MRAELPPARLHVEHLRPGAQPHVDHAQSRQPDVIAHGIMVFPRDGNLLEPGIHLRVKIELLVIARDQLHRLVILRAGIESALRQEARIQRFAGNLPVDLFHGDKIDDP